MPLMRDVHNCAVILDGFSIWFVSSATRRARSAISTLFTLTLRAIRVRVPARFCCILAFDSLFLPATQTLVIIHLLYPRFSATLSSFVLLSVCSGSSRTAMLVRPASSSITRARSCSLSFACCAFSASVCLSLVGTLSNSSDAGKNANSTSSII